MEKVNPNIIEKCTQIVQFISNDLYNVMEFLYNEDTGHIVYSITHNCKMGKPYDCNISIEYYEFTDKSITVCNALKLLGYSTDIKVTYSEDVYFMQEGGSTKEYLDTKLRNLSLSQFTIMTRNTQ